MEGNIPNVRCLAIGINIINTDSLIAESNADDANKRNTETRNSHTNTIFKIDMSL